MKRTLSYIHNTRRSQRQRQHPSPAHPGPTQSKSNPKLRRKRSIMPMNPPLPLARSGSSIFNSHTSAMGRPYDAGCASKMPLSASLILLDMTDISVQAAEA
jgi:hypothetical protein